MNLALTSTIKSIDCRYTSIDPSPSVLERGVTEGVSESDLDLIKGGGAAGRRDLRLRAGLLDWLAELIRWSFQKSPLVPFENLPKKKPAHGLAKA